MEQWTSDIYTAIGIAFVIGIIVGYVLLRFLKGNVQQHIKLENELKAANEKIDMQKQQLEQHFGQSATLLATLVEDYKKLYTHLAQGSGTLLPETKQAEFFKQPQIEVKNTGDNDPPRDYSDGSSGLFKS